MFSRVLGRGHRPPCFLPLRGESQIPKTCFRVKFLHRRWWVAADVPKGATDIEMGAAHQIFRTKTLATNDGWHTWATNYAARGEQPDWRDTGLQCETRRLAG